MEFSQQPVIFVVEDNLIYQNLIAKELESVSRNIHFYTNGESCLEELDKGPSVIVMDYNLDGKLNGLDTLADDASLYEAGMTSHASVNVMLALEDTFDVEFPDEMLKRSVFESVAAISTALAQIEAQAA